MSDPRITMPEAPAIVSIIVVLMFGAVLGLMMLHPVSMDQTTVAILQIMLGALVAAFGTVVQFWMGSSSSSKSKDDMLQQMTLSKDDRDRHDEKDRRTP